MKEKPHRLAYIGTSDSAFTKFFLPALQKLYGDQLMFICVIQKEFEIRPTYSRLLLKFLLALKHTWFQFMQRSNRFYWSIYCHQHSITFETTRDINSEHIRQSLKTCDQALTAGIRKKINRNIYEAPVNGIVNFHYSLLPKYRGTFPVFWQKVHGDFDFGYTFHFINDALDGGDITWQQKVTVDSGKTVPEICDLLIKHASNQLFRLNQHFEKTKQDNSKASAYTLHQYMKYIQLSALDSGQQWKIKCTSAKTFILDDKHRIQLEAEGSCNQKNQIFPNGRICKDGECFIIKKINYLPAVFYYFALRKYFE